jgi:3-hydroxybutyryl-CoA dehydrogenase
MQIVVLTDDGLKEELLNGIETVNADVVFIEKLSQLEQHQNVDAVIDLLYDESHRSLLESFLPSLVIINSVEQTLSETNTSFVRINGWRTFLKSPIIESSGVGIENKAKTEKVFALFNKKLEWLADEVGFITPRVISMIINEAFISLKEGVSTKEEIDTAMKLGTNYPYGPFEWADKIGIEKVYSLLSKLSKDKSRYSVNGEVWK